MSRNTIYRSDKLTVVSGDDHVLGKFLQMYDKDMQDETPEQEGLLFDWSELFGIETNRTGQSNKLEPLVIVNNYIKEKNEENETN